MRRMNENTIFEKAQLDRNQSQLDQSPAQPSPQASLQAAAQGPPLPKVALPDEQGAPPSSLPGTIVKIIVGLLVLIAIFFLIFGIVFPKFSGKNKNEKVTLTYWGLWEDAPIFQSTISEFSRLYPNITVNYVKQDVRDYRERLMVRIENGRGPDVFRFHNTWVPILLPILLPLPTETITKERFSQIFYPVASEDLIKNGAIYGVPLEIDTLSLYVNNDLFRAAGISSPPTNWTDFVNYARKLTVKDEEGKIKTSGAALGTFGNIIHAGDIVSLLFVQNGVDLFNISGNAQAASDALTFYTSFAQSPDNVWDDTLDSSLMSFAKGALAMYFGYSWDFFAIKAVSPNLSFAIYTVPHLASQNITIASYWAEGVSKGSKHQKEALLFLKFLARKETQQKLFAEESKTRAFGEPYSLVEIADLLKDNPLVYPFVQGAQNATSSFFVDQTFDNGLNTQANTYLGNAVSSILLGTSPQTAVETLSQGISQLLQKYSQKQPVTNR